MQLIEIKRDTAPKTGLRAEGGIDYAVIRDADNDVLYFTLVANTGGGYHSKELVPLSRIEACLKSFESGKVVPAKALRDAFTGRSSNNAGFLAACLRHEGLLSAFPDAAHQHQLGEDLTQWQLTMLALEGKPYVPAGATEGVAAPEAVADNDKPKKPRKGKAEKAVDVAPAEASHADPA
jgi:hypothetical protein